MALFEAMVADGARFSGPRDLAVALPRAVASFEGAIFHHAVSLGPLVAAGRISFDGAFFLGDLELKASAEQLSCYQSKFAQNAILRIRWVEIQLDQAEFGGKSLLTALHGIPPVEQEVKDRWANDPASGRTERPKLASVRGTNLGNLTLSDVDLAACLFYEAHELDLLRIEADVVFPGTPPRWRWTKRRTLAEEHHWRTTWRQPKPKTKTITLDGDDFVKVTYTEKRRRHAMEWIRDRLRRHPGCATKSTN